MRLFDTATGKLFPLVPSDGETYRFYCCGPTVYAPAHIGNFRTFVLQDVLRRTLELGGLPTYHVRNLTDVDDKTIQGALNAQQSLADFTAKWTEIFHRDCEALNCLAPHVEPSAVEHIPQQIAMIESLIEKGHAYHSPDGSVYFQISSFPSYGSLSRLGERELALGVTQNQRTEDADEYEKDAAADFVLWKARRPEDGAHYWESPWGKGRPGWHLECSAMIKEYLGDSFDLHGGGVDLLFPHHENELAQSQCACGGSFAKHWFHTTHLLVDGGKMSKSAGNFYTLQDIEDKGYTAAELRYTLIGAHYRKPLNFTLDSLHAAREALQKLAKAQAAFIIEYGEQETLSYEDLTACRPSFGLFEPAWEVLCYDLNTQAAIGKMFAQLKRLKNLSPEKARETWTGWNALLATLGLELPELPSSEAHQETPPEDIINLAERRKTAKAHKNWEEADALRTEIARLGWQLIDTSHGYTLTRGNS